MDYTPHKVLGTYEREQDDVTQLSLDELNRELDGNSIYWDDLSLELMR